LATYPAATSGEKVSSCVNFHDVNAVYAVFFSAEKLPTGLWTSVTKQYFFATDMSPHLCVGIQMTSLTTYVFAFESIISTGGAYPILVTYDDSVPETIMKYPTNYLDIFENSE